MNWLGGAKKRLKIISSEDISINQGFQQNKRLSGSNLALSQDESRNIYRGSSYDMETENFFKLYHKGNISESIPQFKIFDIASVISPPEATNSRDSRPNEIQYDKSSIEFIQSKNQCRINKNRIVLTEPSKKMDNKICELSKSGK